MFRLLLIFTFSIIHQSISCQSSKQFDCDSLIVVNYTRDINNIFFNHVRKIILEGLKTCNGTHDHSKQATIRSLTEGPNRSKKPDLPEKIKNVEPNIKKILLLEYEYDDDFVTIYGTLTTNNGKLISSYSEKFLEKDIDESYEIEKQKLFAFTNKIISKDQSKETIPTYLNNDKFNILILNSKIDKRCPTIAIMPEQNLYNEIKKYFEDSQEFINIIIDNNNVPINDSVDAYERGLSRNVDLVVWHDYFEQQCSGSIIAEVSYKILNSKVSEGTYTSQRKNLDKSSSTFFEEAKSKILLEIAIDALEEGSLALSVKTFDKIPDNDLVKKFVHLKYKAKAELLFNLDMSKTIFSQFVKHIKISLENSDNITDRLNWIMKINQYIIFNKEKHPEAESTLKSQIDYLLRNLDDTFPVGDNDKIYCLKLARLIDNGDRLISSFVNDSNLNSFNLTNELIDFYKDKGFINDVLKYSKTLTQNHPHRPEGYTHIAEYYYENDDYESSFVYCNKILELDFNDAENHLRLSYIYREKGEKNLSNRHYTYAITIDPTKRSGELDKYHELFVTIPDKTTQTLNSKSSPINTKQTITNQPCENYKVKYRLNYKNNNFEEVIKHFSFSQRLKNVIITQNPNFDLSLDKTPLKKGTEIIIHTGSSNFIETVPEKSNLHDFVTPFYEKIEKFNGFSDIFKYRKHIADINGLENEASVCHNQRIVIWEGCDEDSIVDTKKYMTLEEAYKWLINSGLNLREDRFRQLNGTVTTKCKKNKWIVKP